MTTKTSESTESRAGTVEDHPNLRPFKKGQSGNPGGRAKGLGASIREAFGDNPTGLVQFAKDVIEGRPIRGPMARKVKLAEAPDEDDQVWIVARVEERIQMWKLVTEQGWGKPQQNLNIQSQSINARVDLSKLNDRQLEELEQILSQAAEGQPSQGPTVDGEATQAQPALEEHRQAETIPEPAIAEPVTQEPSQS